jgi:hypothetical protein
MNREQSVLAAHHALKANRRYIGVNFENNEEMRYVYPPRKA